ncbi:succinyl-diaminopimelate desuccinylase [Candidatus Cytomitobacter primus]|uniref:Succinyl-diaminopimelate desuccinylase n=1 Tax=Candidatus Cytomitobacter primus TaxID=2066024 RepID=A0A5C0UFL9_9PROT|nr:succinyl-diaminopimelate desuccinylase [Candidatus Cytomitobacter primus]QEK38517.1 succinyl-diaminopimelate desuccinylase [Candidatus Cytomitobacter primus]
MENTLQIIAQLVKYQSITPLGLDCLRYIESMLKSLNFDTEIVKYGPVYNMFAKLEKPGPHICFGGHIDTVPPGNLWANDPNQLTRNGDEISGLGIVDMKGSIGCFLSILQNHIDEINGSISLLLTTDEEGDATDGIKRYIEEGKIKNEQIDLFILGEPTCNSIAGDSVKIGRRGSVTAVLSLEGSKGHIAYPEFANSAINPLEDLISEFNNKSIGESNQYFEATRVQITSINTPNPVENVIPGSVEIGFGTRFNSNYKGEDIIKILSEKIERICTKYKVKYSITWKLHGEPFIINDKNIINWLDKNIQDITNNPVNFNASGATSDGRFLTKLGPVVEIGLEESEAHQTGEKTTIQNIMQLREIFKKLLLNLDTFPKFQV